MNGKLSEPAAAFILDRLERALTLTDVYRREFDRIETLGEQHGFQLLVGRADIGEAVPGNVPLLSPRPLSRAAVNNDLVAVGKYYPPITGLAMAAEIYARIVNVPCHPGMAGLTDAQISSLFRQWAGQAQATKKDI